MNVVMYKLASGEWVAVMMDSLERDGSRLEYIGDNRKLTIEELIKWT